jgi:LDH2 family malate/lactate/ureidoglycolate dehydrogenase
LHNPAFFIAINISFFQDVEAFKERVDNRIRELRRSKKRPDTDRIYMPGERGFEMAEQRLRDGIPIPDNFWEEASALAKELGTDVSDLAGASRAS